MFSYVGDCRNPSRKDEGPLTGTPGWELKFGTGLVPAHGLRWGTLTARAAVEYSEASSSHFDIGEYTVEYLRRLSPEVPDLNRRSGRHTGRTLGAGRSAMAHRPGAIVKLNLGRGLTSKATDWAPELGILFTWGDDEERARWGLPGRCPGCRASRGREGAAWLSCWVSSGVTRRIETGSSMVIALVDVLPVVRRQRWRHVSDSGHTPPARREHRPPARS